MPAFELCAIPGDGIGTEVIPAAVAVLKAVIPELDCRPADAGWQTFLERGDATPPETIAAIQAAGAGLFGAVSSPAKKVEGYRSTILTLRQKLGLRANIRPVDGNWADAPRPDIRLVVVRENSECLYVGQETSDGQTATAQRLITRKASENIGRVAIDVARRYQLNRITIVHKANVLPLTDGLFRDSVRSVLREQLRPEESITVDEMLVDIAALRLVSEPERFGVIVTTNMFGDILSDLAAHWCGGLGVAPSINLGERLALAEPVHGSAPDIAGKRVADPTAAILSAALLCRFHWGCPDIAAQIEAAALAVRQQRRSPGRIWSTDDTAAAIIRQLGADHDSGSPAATVAT